MRQQSYDNSPSLYIVPTPIGNMEDITIRALNVLEKVDVIFSEDTRETGNLLNYYNIKSPKLISSHKFNENNNSDKLLNYLKEGKQIALVSDRGTPAISDPGYSLVKVCINHNYNVICLPGATAFVPALVMSGFSTDRFYFYGFLNSKKSHKKKELDSLKNINVPIIFYEAPHRIVETLTIIKDVFGNRKIALVREISKKFEEVIRDNIDNVIQLADSLKGEMVVIVEGNHEKKDFSDLSIVDHVNIYLKEGQNTKEAIKLVATDRGLKKSEVYNEYHRR